MTMLLDKLLLQIPVATPDTVAANKIQEATNAVTAHVDSLTTKLHPDSIAAMTPGKLVDKFKYLDLGSLVTSLSSQLVSLALRILAAVVIFYVGKFIINKIYSLARAVMIRKDFDRSLTSFLLSFIRITLLFLLIITVIGVLGIETSSFIAIFASAGVAIGMALSGTLQNFAGGVLILMLKPYKVGDYIEFGELKGSVREIQIFNTVINTYNTTASSSPTAVSPPVRSRTSVPSLTTAWSGVWASAMVTTWTLPVRSPSTFSRQIPASSIPMPMSRKPNSPSRRPTRSMRKSPAAGGNACSTGNAAVPRNCVRNTRRVLPP